MSTSKLFPSYYGYVGSTKDALLIIQEIVDKQLDLVPRRPHERERPNLIKSGNVFVFIEEHSGIKRWTDGIAWSPSRILGRFLVYRELDKHSLNEKDDKKKKKRKISVDQDPLDSTSGHSGINGPTLIQPTTPAIPHAQQLLHQQDSEYSPNNKNLQGNLVTSYVFKDQGLIKKTLSLTTTTKELHIEKREAKQTIHLISYYNADDVLNGKLQRPSKSDLKNLTISNALWNSVKDSSLGGKIPIEDEAYYFLDTNYQLQNMSLLQQPSHQTNQGPPQHLSQSQHPGQSHQQLQHQIHPPSHMQYVPQKYNIPPQHNTTDGIPPGFTRHNSHPPSHLGPNSQFVTPTQQSSGSQHQPPSGQIHQLQPGEYPQYSNTTVKEEGSANSLTGPSNELVFTNPFTGTPHQPSFTYGGQSSAPGSGAGSGSGAPSGTSIPYSMGAPQQYHPGFAQQVHQQNQQHNQDSSTSGSHYAPYSQHYSQQVFGPQQQGQLSQSQQQPYNLGSISGSSDQFSVGGISNGSISSVSSNLVHGNSASNSFSGTPPSSVGPKKNYRSGSGGGSGSSISGPAGGNGSNGWFTTNPPTNASGNYIAPNQSTSNDGGDGNSLGSQPNHLYPHSSGSVPGIGGSGTHSTHPQFYLHPSHPLTTSTTGGSSASAGTLVSGGNEEPSSSSAPTATASGTATNSSSYGYSNTN